ncbi:MAG TPA: AtpZ/AtpI family protein [Bacteroidia bacterium]
MKQEPKSPRSNSYLKYTGMAFQMGAIITIGVLGGRKLDQWMGWKTPIFTLVLSLVSIVAAIYLSIKDFLKPKK